MSRTCKVIQIGLCFILGIMGSTLTAQSKPLVVGIALGYPPYQFTDSNGEPTGIDAELTRLVFKEAGIEFKFLQTKWDDVYLGLVHKSGIVDVLCGAEVNPERTGLLDFTSSCYSRSSALFVLTDSNFKSLDEMKGKIITGDKDSFFQEIVKGKNMRVMTTVSKEESFQLLKAKKVDAVIAPLQVGQWIAKQMNLSIRILPESSLDSGSPVAFAVAKGNTQLAQKLTAALETLNKNGAIKQIIKKYQ